MLIFLAETSLIAVNQWFLITCLFTRCLPNNHSDFANTYILEYFN